MRLARRRRPRLRARPQGLLRRDDRRRLDLQLGAPSTSTAYVSVTVGGNDAGFVDVLTTYALRAWASS